ncbi:MAG: DNA cytosine methyltransferase [Vampirovibrionales bacterium]|nr:DNA cytosine methyltransferase [Vampirovibrionales bacterium]
MPKPTVLSLFSGCGGSSLGYQGAGFDIVGAVEYDSNAASVYRLNHPNTRLYEADISLLEPHVLMAELNLQPGDLAILDGSPPCQGFSTAGKRVVTDPRNNLFQHYIRFLKALQPKAFVMENVPGLVSGRMRPIFWQIIKSLESCGYTVTVRILNASHYGVAQRRQRLIILGMQKELNRIPKHPEPTSLPVSFRQAVQSLPLKAHSLILHPTGKALALATSLREGESGADLHRRYKHKGNDFSLMRLAWDKPSPTICKTIRAGQCGLLHPEELRYLSIGEIKRISSFPDSYQLLGCFEQQWGRIGNAVPPLLMKAVAISLMTQLEEA